jgi:hypothetical protein
MNKTDADLKVLPVPMTRLIPIMVGTATDTLGTLLEVYLPQSLLVVALHQHIYPHVVAEKQWTQVVGLYHLLVVLDPREIFSLRVAVETQ